MTTFCRCFELWPSWTGNWLVSNYRGEFFRLFYNLADNSVIFLRRPTTFFHFMRMLQVIRFKACKIKLLLVTIVKKKTQNHKMYDHKNNLPNS